MASQADFLITKLTEGQDYHKLKYVKLSDAEIKWLCNEAKKSFKSQPMLLKVDAPVKICGDIHGQYNDLLRLLTRGGSPSNTRYLFLGDYVDRGKQSLETICLLLAFKIRFPDTFFLLRGNHEIADINKDYGFYDECIARYSESIWDQLNSVFNFMPVAAIVGSQIFAVHGGISQFLRQLNQINRLKRPFKVPNSGIVHDMLWSDPSEEQNGWSRNEERGASYTFGADAIEKFLERHNLSMIVRAHEEVDGFKMFSSGKLVTIFSATNYRGQSNNAGGIMVVDAALRFSFEMLHPVEKGAAAV